MRNWFTIKAAQGDAPAEITIFDEIGGWGVTAQQFNREFKALQGDRVKLLINSPGGSVVDALAICNTLVHSGKTIEGKVMGIAASAASVIAMACTTLEMPENTFLFLHDPLGYEFGDADDHRAMADVLDQIGKPLVAMYAKRSKQDAEKIEALLKADSLLSAEECLALSLCDTVSSAITATARFDPDGLPPKAAAIFAAASSKTLADSKTPFATRVKALAEAHGLGEFAAVWVVAADITTIEAAQSVISEAAEVKAICEAAGAPEMTVALVRARTSPAEARVEISAALVAEDDASVTSTAKPSRPNRSVALTTNDIWAQVRAAQEKKE